MSLYFDKLKKPFIIAEMSGNHNHSLNRALEIVEAAAKCGVSALKLQTYTADTMTLNINEGEFYISNPSSLWFGQSLYDLYEKAYTPWEWHEPIFKRCRELGIIGFSTPFDHTAVDFLETLNVPFYKIASFEMTDQQLIKKVAQTRKPIIVSTGMATVSEIDEMVRTARENGCPEIVLLKCTSTYPAKAKYSNLLTIPHMKDLFNCRVGLSDHTLGIGVSVASVALGASVIEKHFTLSRLDGGVDAEFSLEPKEMELLVDETNQAWESLGSIHYGLTKGERAEGRRSLYIAKDMKKGDIFTEMNVRSIRPGKGLETKYLDVVIGRTAKTDLKKGTPLSWDIL